MSEVGISILISLVPFQFYCLEEERRERRRAEIYHAAAAANFFFSRGHEYSFAKNAVASGGSPGRRAGGPRCALRSEAPSHTS